MKKFFRIYQLPPPLPHTHTTILAIGKSWIVKFSGVPPPLPTLTAIGRVAKSSTVEGSLDFVPLYFGLERRKKINFCIIYGVGSFQSALIAPLSTLANGKGRLAKFSQVGSFYAFTFPPTSHVSQWKEKDGEIC